MIYAFVRHGVDALNLITVYRKEINSNGALINDVLNTVVVVLLVYQVCMAAYFALNEKDIESLTCVVILLLTSLILVLTHDNANDQQENTQEHAKNEFQLE
jgi:hypothetical protein